MQLITKNKISDHPQCGALISSETPKDMEPMKSFRVVLSQSHTSMDKRLSLSDGFSLLHRDTKEKQDKTFNLSNTLFLLQLKAQKC